MRARLVLPLLSRKMLTIGQERWDTALFRSPDGVSRLGRGRSKTYGYGIKIMPEAIENLPVTQVKLNTLWPGAVSSSAHCGDNGAFSQRDAVARGKVRILRSGKIALVKNTFAIGYSNALWRELWIQISSTAWTLVQLLSLVAEEAFPIDVVAPWRDKQPLIGVWWHSGGYAWNLPGLLSGTVQSEVLVIHFLQTARISFVSPSVVPSFRWCKDGSDCLKLRIKKTLNNCHVEWSYKSILLINKDL